MMIIITTEKMCVKIFPIQKIFFLRNIFSAKLLQNVVIAELPQGGARQAGAGLVWPGVATQKKSL